MQMMSVLVALSAVIFAVSPALTPDFGGFDPALYPIPQDNPPVQPAGYAFAIWGVIYTWLVVSAVFGLVKRRDALDWAPMRVPLLLSLLIGAGWLPVAMVSPIWATIMIFAMLVTATMALVRAPGRDRWWAAAPVALFAGWLTAAAHASLGLTGAGYGIVFGELGWALVAIPMALVVALAIHVLRRDEPFYFVAVIWALIAIAVKNGADVPVVTAVASIGAAFLTMVMLRSWRELSPYRRPGLI